ncbi:MAG TPA: acetyl-CoA carboxylase biotin carboxyl carrier protein [Longimicrobium sp.]|nr:acetyl-CoA carboxylase biotin carboxyl carrier protein [Longimicrobium sp.]
MIDLEFLRGLIGAVDESGIDSLEISRGGTRIRISKTPPPAPVAAQAAAPAAPAHLHMPPVHEVGVPRAGTPAAAQAAAEAAPAAAPAASNLVEIKSPMVGTFYRAPAPEAPPYAEVGSRVSKGQTLCILEAMKLMNELESDVAGTVREVCVENGEPVEYGQVLFRIEPAA